MENQHPFPHRLTIKRRIISYNFELGKGAIVNLNYASRGLLKLLRAVYHQDRDALEMSQASATYLLGTKGNNFTNEYIPCISIPKVICFQPKIVKSDSHGS